MDRLLVIGLVMVFVGYVLPAFVADARADRAGEGLKAVGFLVLLVWFIVFIVGVLRGI